MYIEAMAIIAVIRLGDGLAPNFCSIFIILSPIVANSPPAAVVVKLMIPPKR